MHRVLLVVESQTERELVEQVLAPYLGARGRAVVGKVVEKPGHKGGNIRFDRVAEDVMRLLKQEPASTVGTFVDFYQMESDWPGIPPGCGRRPLNPIPVEAVDVIQNSVRGAIEQRMGGALRPGQFIPYLQVHEIEALFFSDPVQMASVFGQPHLAGACENLIAECGGCGAINHGEETQPAKRISTLFGRYRKGDGARSDAIPMQKPSAWNA